ncbi:hypothetical protein [Priestia megaterium]|uniref:hypothetical protein n=1 Tax=Priestia megaterium TaxID=1404 RepID=UPI001BECCF9C|nr:hypothetical protein [Priestia megaterium]MBT2257068.1 hypothetical protein [Priestia megaterium]MBT2276716.1 hypothetical protein [Priestia megaterium]
MKEKTEGTHTRVTYFSLKEVTNKLKTFTKQYEMKKVFKSQVGTKGINLVLNELEEEVRNRK